MSSVWKPWDEIPAGRIRCTDPAVIDAAAAIAVAALRRKQEQEQEQEQEQVQTAD